MYRKKVIINVYELLKHKPRIIPHTGLVCSFRYYIVDVKLLYCSEESITERSIYKNKQEETLAQPSFINHRRNEKYEWFRKGKDKEKNL